MSIFSPVQHTAIMYSADDRGTMILLVAPFFFDPNLQCFFYTISWDQKKEDQCVYLVYAIQLTLIVAASFIQTCSEGICRCDQPTSHKFSDATRRQASTNQVAALSEQDTIQSVQ
jgi:hypothetical protein